MPDEKQYWFAYEAIKKEWSVGVLDDAIKALDKTKLKARLARKPSNIFSPMEKQLTEQLGFQLKIQINKNDTGSFRIPFHSKEEMQRILEKLGGHPNMETEQ